MHTRNIHLYHRTTESSKLKTEILNTAIYGCHAKLQLMFIYKHVKLQTKIFLTLHKMLRYTCLNLFRKTRPILNYCNTPLRLLSLQQINYCEVREEKLKAVVNRLAEQTAQVDERETEEESENEDKKKRRESAWKSVKTSLVVIGATFGCLSGFLVYWLGKPPVDEDGYKIKDEYSELPLWQQYFYRTLKEIDYYKRLIKEPSREKLLPDVMQYPYYQPPYTLVLELTDVLVHPEWTYQTGWRFKKRPGVDYFLESLQGMFEVVIYTAEQGMTVFPILEALDPKNYISYKLVRDATHFVDGNHVKSLGKLNRDLSKVIVIDWNQDNVKFHKENLLHLPRWDGNDDDTTLVDLASFLQTIAQTEVGDVREVLKYYSEFENPLQTFRLKQQELLKLMENQKQDRSKKDKTRMLLKF